jgi:Ca-activated chloride channel family protein
MGGTFHVQASGEDAASDVVEITPSPAGADVVLRLWKRAVEEQAVTVNNTVDGGLLLEVPSAAIRPFKLITSGASAKYGEQSTGVARIEGDSLSKVPVLNRIDDIAVMMPGVVRTGGADGVVEGGAEGAVEGGVAGGVVGGVLGGTLGTPLADEISIGGGSAAHRIDGAAEQPARLIPETSPRVEPSPFVSPLDQPLSTFGIDVDTASYSIVRSILRAGEMPPADLVRTEEIVNAFTYDDPAPAGGDAFAATTEIAECPWAPSHDLVRIGIKGAVLETSERPALNLVFLVDVSGSMEEPNKLPLVPKSLKLLVDSLRADDTVGLVVYAGAAGVVLEPTSDKGALRAAIDRLQAGGSTAGGAGIEAAYALAEAHLRKDGANRVVLATDGDFNVGVSSEGELVRLIETKREKGVFLSVLGVGDGNYQDRKMEQLADHGNGNYAYLDSLDEAKRVLVERGCGTLVTIAKDVKIQVEMNPRLVAQYRLIGYENRVMPDRDFDDDAKDGGEIGAGHVVTALYEIVPATLSQPAARSASKLRYQDGPEPSAASKTGELATIRLRWKLPDGVTSDLAETQVPLEDVAFGSATDDFRWSACAAAFAELLRGSKELGGFGWSDLLALAPAAKGADADGRRAEMIELARAAAALAPPAVAVNR